MLRMCRGGTHADVEEAFQRIFLGDSKLEDAVFHHAHNVTVSKIILEEKEFRMHAMRFASLLATLVPRYASAHLPNNCASHSCRVDT